MSRATKYRRICTPELKEQFHEQNKYLISSFLDYLRSTDKARSTIDQYRNDLDIFFAWNVSENENKPFIQISKKEFTKFQGKALSDWEWSSNRIIRVKAVISSLSNYIENILDEEEEFKNYRPVIRKIANPVNEPVREKTIFTKEELDKLLETLVTNNKIEQACGLSLAINSARRKSELTRFKVSYFDESNVLFDKFYKTPEKVVTKGRGSKGKLLNLYVLKDEFDPYLKLWLKEREEKGITSEWLFPCPTNPKEHASGDIFDGWAELFTKLAGKDFYWHSIRHFATTEFIKSNFPPHIIKGIIGWESADMIDVYNDLTTDDMLEQYFKEQAKQKDED